MTFVKAMSISKKYFKKFSLLVLSLGYKANSLLVVNMSKFLTRNAIHLKYDTT